MTKECLPQKSIIRGVRIPTINPPQLSDSDEGFEDWALEIYEWLSLIAMESPRICFEDTIDTFLSRYQVPNGDSGKASDTITMRWTGLIPSYWVRKLFIFLSW